MAETDLKRDAIAAAVEPFKKGDRVEHVVGRHAGMLGTICSLGSRPESCVYVVWDRSRRGNRASMSTSCIRHAPGRSRYRVVASNDDREIACDSESQAFTFRDFARAVAGRPVEFIVAQKSIDGGGWTVIEPCANQVDAAEAEEPDA